MVTTATTNKERAISKASAKMSTNAPSRQLGTRQAPTAASKNPTAGSKFPVAKKQPKKPPTDFVKKNILASTMKFKTRKPINGTLAKNRLGVIEFPVDDSSYLGLRSLSARRSSDAASISAVSKTSGKVVIQKEAYNFNIYKQVNKPLPKPGVFFSGSPTGRGPLPREIRRTVKYSDGLKGLEINVDSSPRGSNSGSHFGVNQLTKDPTLDKLKQSNSKLTMSRGRSRNMDLASLHSGSNPKLRSTSNVSIG